MWKKTILLLAILCVQQCRPEEESSEEWDPPEKPPRPHIFFIFADDCGWNDVGFHNKDIKTPTLDLLAYTGVILNQSYVENLCTPSRTAFLTGYDPHKTGSQILVYPQFAQTGLPLQFKLLPEKLKELGYDTHIVGKWHLGSCNPAYLPFNRGFDTSFGMMNAGEDYYTHSLPYKPGNTPTPGPGIPEIYDYFNKSEVALSYNGTYSSISFVKQVQHILNNANPNKPLFLYLPFQLAHCPLQVPQDKIDLYPNIQNAARRNFSAMMSQLDCDVFKIMLEIIKSRFYDNSVTVFTGDNGGEVDAGGNNYPFKGSKHTLWEGGHRAAAFVHSPLLEKKGYTYNGLIHITDFHTTLLKLAGGKPEADLDGVDAWEAISKNKTSNRTEMVYHLQNNGSKVIGAIRVGDYKLIIGKAGLPDYAVPPGNVTGLFAYTMGGDIFFEDIPNYPQVRLFNLKDDPTENYNLALTNPEKVKELLKRVDELKLEMVDPTFQLNNLTLYKEKNGVEILGTNWCNAIQNVTLIDWNSNLPNSTLPF